MLSVDIQIVCAYEYSDMASHNILVDLTKREKLAVWHLRSNISSMSKLLETLQIGRKTSRQWQNTQAWYKDLYGLDQEGSLYTFWDVKQHAKWFNWSVWDPYYRQRNMASLNKHFKNMLTSITDVFWLISDRLKTSHDLHQVEGSAMVHDLNGVANVLTRAYPNLGIHKV